MTDPTYRCGCPCDDADPTCAQHGQLREPRVLKEGWMVFSADGRLLSSAIHQTRPHAGLIFGETAIKVRLVEVVE